jgi:hypothetical protein
VTASKKKKTAAGEKTELRNQLALAHGKIAALEARIAGLEAERDGMDVRADLAFDTAREDRVFGRHR